MPAVRFTAAARADLDDALTWYATQAPHVVPQFRQALRGVVARIAENPRQFPSSPHGTRQALMRRFPYLVIFRQTDEACVVVAIFHTSREPRFWKRSEA